ncbi:YigZ family protein [Niameybacter massiliensis]|uniref:YigZ family protein n=1 Tax=Holtiella tumoricola TaxID=3018743 RepID=A0AA42DLH6_9FIRM|nr:MULTISPECIES: YigZ family protein [Lachnospirales]MDA3731272.1 YigZ family protein [Holtiella tumoricola]
MLERYITIEGEGYAEIVEKKSRFIASVFPVESQEEADAILAKLRKKYWDATHNCFAYQIGERDEIQRFSDDGEPGGTAGKPILDVLKGHQIKNTLIVVTRYFGGTLLGTGGLVRAYGKGAKEGILAAGLVEKMRVCLFTLEMTYPLSGKVQYLLNDKAYVIRETQYTDVVRFIVEVEMGEEEAFTEWLIEKTNAEISIEKGDYDLIQRSVKC